MKKQINHKILFLTIFLSLLCFTRNSFAAPAISGVSGTLSHGNSATITGSGFGTKSTAAPTLWDDCSGTNILDLWDNCLGGAVCYGGGGGDTSKDLAYRTPAQAGRGVALPHSHITKYMCGSQYFELVSGGHDLTPWIYHSVSSQPAYTYVSWYRRIDPLWAWSSSENNFKDLSWSDTLTGTPYTNNYYLSHYGATSPHYEGIWAESGSVPWTASVMGAHEILENGWVKTEWVTRWADSGGWMRVYENGVLKYEAIGDTWLGNGPQCLGIEGYFEGWDDNDWRYMADIYIDYSAQRVLIGNASTLDASTTVRAVQIPSAWSDTSITAKVNQDAFADGATAYLYVFDATGTANSTGYPITFGGGGGDTTAPNAPSGLSVS